MIKDYKDITRKWARTGVVDGKQTVLTISYQKWCAMRQRCKVGGPEQRKNLTYIGCSMSGMFSDFQLFTDWHVQQVGYGVEGYNLDKDILFDGNKLYSEHTCVLVPRQLNTFIVDQAASRGEYPRGVSWHKHTQKYRADVCINGKQKYIGLYTSVEVASAAYEAAKEAEAFRWYERLSAGEFIVDERVIERMKNWKVKLWGAYD